MIAPHPPPQKVGEIVYTFHSLRSGLILSSYGGKFCFFKCKILIPIWLVSEYFPRGCRLPVFPESYGM